MKLAVLLYAAVFSADLWAFPENVRHGYFSCTACHVSPAGGGVLTPYGRSLSAELMSTWGTPKPARPFFTNNEDEGVSPYWLRAGVFARAVQTYRNTQTAETAKFIPMQEDLEAGVDVGKFAVIASVGLRAKNSRSTNLNEIFSRRHYLLYRLTDAINVRAGKFMFAFGLNGPDHITATRRGLGWNQGMESYNVELSYLGEKSASIVTAVTSSPQDQGLSRDSGGALTQNFLIGEQSKLGLNAYYGSQSLYTRFVYGPSWVLSITKRIFLNSELCAQTKKTKENGLTENGYAMFHRLNFEAAKGVTPFLQADRSFLDNSSRESMADSYGLGVQWLPYSHFEVVGLWGKEKSYGQSPTDFGWLMLNLYL